MRKVVVLQTASHRRNSVLCGFGIGVDGAIKSAHAFTKVILQTTAVPSTMLASRVYLAEVPPALTTYFDLDSRAGPRRPTL